MALISSDAQVSGDNVSSNYNSRVCSCCEVSQPANIKPPSVILGSAYDMSTRHEVKRIQPGHNIGVSSNSKQIYAFINNIDIVSLPLNMPGSIDIIQLIISRYCRSMPLCLGVPIVLYRVVTVSASSSSRQIRKLHNACRCVSPRSLGHASQKVNSTAYFMRTYWILWQESTGKWNVGYL